MTQTKPPLVVITGASSGIGAACARSFSQLGHPLLLLARRTEKMRALNLPNCLIAHVDVTNHEEFGAAVTNAEKEFGPTDLLVNNAGVMLLGKVGEQNPAEWQTMLQVNIFGLLNGMSLVVKEMAKRGHGTIINISSVAGKKLFPNHSVYCGTKFAVHAISEGVREEVADANVRVIVVAPGAVETELLSHTTSDRIKKDYASWRTSMGGAISSENIADAAVFAYSQPQNVCVREIVVAPTRQSG